MPVPIYVLTGFLGSGKTTFLSKLLNRHDWRSTKILLLQFERGEEPFYSQFENCEVLSFSKKQFDGRGGDVAKRIAKQLDEGDSAPDEIWIEWNGVSSFSDLQTIFRSPLLIERCQIKKVLHIAEQKNIEYLLGRTGTALPEQIANSDMVICRTEDGGTPLAATRKQFRAINPGVRVFELRGSEFYGDFYRQLFSKRLHPVNFFFVSILLFIASFYFLSPALDAVNLPLNTIVNVFLGMILQAIPFLLIGVILSSALQVFVPQSWIERKFPKSLGVGMLVAILAGFCLPVCDCASIPIFRSLVKKGVPLPVAVTFMKATPVINPLVMLSTYYAFSGNMSIVIGRVCLGIICAVIIGLLTAIKSPKASVLAGGGLDRLMCSCGCYEDTESVETLGGKFSLFLNHSQAEFFDVGKYLVVGSFVAAIFQILGTDLFTSAQSGAGLAFSMLIMMAMAFILSLCSSSDAVVARSFSRQFPIAAIMAFLVFGPMMDIKNVMMLSAGFSKRFIARLLLTAAVVCFTVIFILYGTGVV